MGLWRRLSGVGLRRFCFDPRIVPFRRLGFLNASASPVIGKAKKLDSEVGLLNIPIAFTGSYFRESDITADSVISVVAGEIAVFGLTCRGLVEFEVTLVMTSE